MDQDDEDVLAQLAVDVDRSFERLMTYYWHQLYAFVLRRTASSEDAEDIVSETFIRVYIALKGYPAARIRALQIRPWLYKITYNEYCRYVSKSAHSPAALTPMYEGIVLEPEEDASQQPDLLFEHAERRRELEELVKTLPERYREAVSLFYFEEFSYQEIADLLDQPLGTIKSNVHRGIQLLRKILSTQSNEVY